MPDFYSLSETLVVPELLAYKGKNSLQGSLLNYWEHLSLANKEEKFLHSLGLKCSLDRLLYKRLNHLKKLFSSIDAE